MDPWPPVMASNPPSGSEPTATTNSLFSFLCSTLDLLLESEEESLLDVFEHPASVPINNTILSILAIFFFSFILI